MTRAPLKKSQHQRRAGSAEAGLLQQVAETRRCVPGERLVTIAGKRSSPVSYTHLTLPTNREV